MFVVKRSKQNPIIAPTRDHSFESFTTFNGSPVEVGRNIHLLYRAQSTPERFENNNFSLSTIGKAISKDGITFDKREQFIYPEYPWERFGLEDPRVTKISNKYFIFYTALSTFPFSGDGIKVGLAISKDMKNISEKHLVTPFNSKAMVLFPEKINGKYVALLSVNTDRPPSKIALVEFDEIEDMWDQKRWDKWYKDLDKHTLSIPKSDGDQVEGGAVPIKTEEGWLFVYSHINNYFSNDKVFGVRALLLDLNDPKKIIGQTRGAILVPEESYEKFGQVPNTIFPSGALVKKNKLLIYYGATDTTVAVAEVDLGALLLSMKMPRVEIAFKRQTYGPMLSPRKNFAWESRAVFNPASIFLGGRTHILYRAMSQDNTSVIGYAETKDNINIKYRGDKPIYLPRESFEEKRVAGGNSGCEDPRLTKIDDTIYMCYTAFNGVDSPKVAITSISTKNFLDKRWLWKKPVLVTRDGVDDKDGCLHPEKVNGKYILFHRVDNRICVDTSDTPEFKDRNNFRNTPILSPRPGMWDGAKVGISAPPIKTAKGWVLFYHGVSSNSQYRVGAVLLDLKEPTNVLARITDTILEPKESYELNGQIGNVVFPCGAVVKGDTVYLYYGGGDTVVGVASMSMSKLLEALTF